MHNVVYHPHTLIWQRRKASSTIESIISLSTILHIISGHNNSGVVLTTAIFLKYIPIWFVQSRLAAMSSTSLLAVRVVSYWVLSVSSYGRHTESLSTADYRVAVIHKCAKKGWHHCVCRAGKGQGYKQLYDHVKQWKTSWYLLQQNWWSNAFQMQLISGLVFLQ